MTARTATISYAAAKLQLALCFHHAVLDARDELAAAISLLRELTRSGDYAYYIEIAHFDELAAAISLLRELTRSGDYAYYIEIAHFDELAAAISLLRELTRSGDYAYYIEIAHFDELAAAISLLRELTRSGDYAYYIEIAHFMADLPLPPNFAQARWLDGERRTRERWRNTVMTRRNRLGTAR